MFALNAPTTIALAAVGLAVVAIVVFVVVKRLTGSVTVEIDQRRFRPGDTISGDLLIEARRAIDFQAITVSVVCRDGNDNDAAAPVERFRHDICLHGAGRLAPNDSLHLRFELPVPSPDANQQLTVQLPAVGGSLLEGIADAAERRQRRHHDWSVRASVELASFTIDDQVRIEIDTSEEPASQPHDPTPR